MVNRDRRGIQRRWPLIAADFAGDAVLMCTILAIAYQHIEKSVRSSLVGKNGSEVHILT